MRNVREHYLRRIAIGKELNNLLSRNSKKYVPLALGITEIDGNYSASDHDLGPKILSERTPAVILKLAKVLASCKSHQAMLNFIYSAAVPWLKVSVGSEIAMLLKPATFWVANTRTVWAHLLLKHDFDYEVANEALRLYRIEDPSSEMAYKIWKAIYMEMESSVIAFTALGNKEAQLQKVKPGEQQNLWFDAIANELYERNQS